MIHPFIIVSCALLAMSITWLMWHVIQWLFNRMFVLPRIVVKLTCDAEKAIQSLAKLAMAICAAQDAMREFDEAMKNIDSGKRT